MGEVVTESYLRWLRKEFESSPFWKHMGITVERLEPGNVLLKLPVNDHIKNSNGVLHGGTVTSLLDSVIAATIRSSSEVRVATISLTTNFIAPVRSGTLFATATITNPGKRVQYAEAKVVNDHDEVVSTAVGTFMTLKEK